MSSICFAISFIIKVLIKIADAYFFLVRENRVSISFKHKEEILFAKYLKTYKATANTPLFKVIFLGNGIRYLFEVLDFEV